MPEDPVRRMYEEARGQLQTARTAVAYWEQVVTGLSGIMAIAPTMEPVPPAPEKPLAPTNSDEHSEGKTYPRSPDAVENVLRANPNMPMRFPDIWKRITESGQADPSIKSGINAYQNAARRLAEDPKSAVHRQDDGRYIYRTDAPAAAPQGPSLRGPSGITGLQPLEGFAS